MPRAIARASPLRIPSLSVGTVRNLSQATSDAGTHRTTLVQCRTMRMCAAALAALFLVCVMARPAEADATVFLGTTTSPTHRTVKGFAAGVSLVIVGFEF